MAKMMLKVAVPPNTILNTVHAKDQIYSKISMSFAVRWKDVLDGLWHLVDKDGNYHTVVYNKDLDKPAIVAEWTTLRDFYHLTGDHQVSLTHYDKDWTHLHLEDVAECRLVFNHWRKTLKIGVGWKHFYETLSLIADMEIVFEFIDLTVNHVLF
ncbi:hypothetical protein HKD37_16G045421 [Glycine soja]